MNIKQVTAQCGCNSKNVDASLMYVSDYTVGADPMSYSGSYNVDAFHAMKIYGYEAPPNEEKPVLILFHGGAFSDGSFNNKDINTIASILSTCYGYEVILPNYFQDCDWKSASGNTCYSGTTTISINAGHSLKRTIFQALLDARSVLADVVKDSDALNINPNKISIGGTSAGGMVAMLLKFIQSGDIGNVFPGYSSTYQHTETICDWTVGSSSDFKYKWHSTATDISYTPITLIDLWGGLLDGSSSLNYISSGELVPTLLLQGDQDGILPYTYDRLMFSTNTSMPYINGANNIYSYLNSTLSYSNLYFATLQDACHNPADKHNNCSTKLIKSDSLGDLLGCFFMDYPTAFGGGSISDVVSCSGGNWDFSASAPFDDCLGSCVLKIANGVNTQNDYSVYVQNHLIIVSGLEDVSLPLKAELLDATGKIIFIREITSSSDQVELAYPSIPIGIYFLQVFGPGIDLREKIFLE